MSVIFSNRSRISDNGLRTTVGVFSVLACLVLPRVASAIPDEPVLSPGLYRLEMNMATQSRIPFLGSSRSSSVSVSLVEIRRDGAGLIQSHRVCDFRVKEDSAMVRMVFPEKFIASLARPTYSIQLEQDSAGWRYRADLGTEHIGYRPGQVNGKLPTQPDDPAVYDWDGDGRPGATLKLSVPLLPDGELYVVQRGHSILSGRLTGPGRIEGRIDIRLFEQRVLGAWPSFLNQTPEIEPDPKASWFTLTQLAPGSSCESLRPKERHSPPRETES